MSTEEQNPGATRGARLRAQGRSGELIVLRTSEETRGRLIEVEAICRPGPPGVEERSFANHDVGFEVLEGRLTVGARGEARVLRAGESTDLPAGTPHRIWVEPERPETRFIWRMRPAPLQPDYIELLFGPPETTSNQPTESQEIGGPHV